MKLFLLIVLAAVAVADDLPPSCSKPVYCNSKLLHYVQMARIFPDSKTFVDRHLKHDEDTTLKAFDALLEQTNNDPTKKDLEDFVNTYFDSVSELDNWTPTDYSPEPLYINQIRDEKLKQFARDINIIWPHLGRKMKPEVFENPDLYSIVPVPNGFIIPGGRFTELYYWDAYWIVEGLLISDMNVTAKGMIENLIELLKVFGHVPNGGRWYYQERSQPPLLSAMMLLYIRATKDIDFLKANIDALEDELNYWLETQRISFEKDDRSYTLLRYYAPSDGPRPESYYEDYINAQTFKSRADQNKFYVDIKSAAESGWDFSSRWFVNPDGTNTGNITTVNTRNIIPVDLNAIFTNALQNMAYFQALLNNRRKAAHWGYLSKQFKSSVKEVLWNDTVGVWLDYDLDHNQHRNYFYPSNLAPLWMGAVERKFVKRYAERVLGYLKDTHSLDFPGGVPTSLIRSGEQWDFPNAWPPLISIVVNSLEALGTEEANIAAFNVAQTWVRSNLKGFTENKQMFEKYDAEVPGRVGGGGEYTVQDGFGWSNGVVLEFLAKYGRTLTAEDTPEDDTTSRSLENASGTEEKES